ncbi:ankyrin repeat domain-containing protein SOWAHB isoform X2 [Sitophilus oryzae]|uniref:Ankyrin repeat domain-containing protein SOWAHB isoform X2 n=1 Tax=Sitophilus oryzae TaxID=7048 RepID=A0A6J2YW18_SITOR|nr:ankyrin repeat domain-containing protein SOWAHB isoform X2 [Sitophilus oryzae]
MASKSLSIEEIHQFFRENGGKVKNKDVVRHFKKYLTDPATKDENRKKFKEFVNLLAHTKQEAGEKILILKSQYNTSKLSLTSRTSSTTSLTSPPPLRDPRNAIGIPTSPSTPPRQPPPYRNPPPVVSPNSSFDSISLSSTSTVDDRPQAPPRRRSGSEEKRNVLPGGVVSSLAGNGAGKEVLSVKERTQQFNRMASTEEELTPTKTPKSAEKEKKKSRGVSDDSETSTQTPIDAKKCQEWYVTTSKGDLQELLKLAKEEPRLVNKKDPFTYNVLHWGAKHGNEEIIKIFTGSYKVDINSRTNGGYTPLHIAAQFAHKDFFKKLLQDYHADPNIRDYSGRTPEYYLLAKQQKENNVLTVRKIKGRKKQSDKDLGFLRIGSFNVRVKKTTEAFSNFLGVGSSSSVTPVDSMSDKVHKGWGSADNLNKEIIMGPPKNYGSRKKSKKNETSMGSIPSTPKTPTKNYSSTSLPIANTNNDSDSDSAAGFDSSWKK